MRGSTGIALLMAGLAMILCCAVLGECGRDDAAPSFPQISLTAPLSEPGESMAVYGIGSEVG